MALLELRKVQAGYGSIKALHGISLEVDAGQIVTLIGSNGAGKSTTLRTISGLVRARSGSITLAGERIDHLDAHAIVNRGVSQAPEGRRVFRRMTVLENLEMGSFSRKDGEIKGAIDHVFTLFPRLRERAKQPAGTMSGGEQQMLAIGRALMARPKVLLLDEPSMGLSPVLTETIYRTILEINKQGTTILLVEQNALVALSICHRGYVIQTGRIVLEDTGKALLANEMVRKAYLGED
ncbi:MAG: ABC transporter ATP-binding protein [Chloroflexota bacterium]|nr:ABC transporter ATP-binding protein [Chloroflexota bacterium]